MFYIDLYLHEYFEPILFLDPPMDYIAHCSMGKFEGKLGAYGHIYMNYVHDFDVFYVTL